MQRLTGARRLAVRLGVARRAPARAAAQVPARAILPAMREAGWLLLCAALAAVAPVLGERAAQASVSIAVTFDALLHDSHAVVVGTAAEQMPVWEEGRIYTYTRLHVDTAVAGELSRDDEVWVKTMGGVVGKVGQIVDGEAELTVGRPTLLFLRRTPSQSWVVTARAQGQFGVYVDDQKIVRVKKSSGVGALFAPRGAAAGAPLAADVIHGRIVTDVARDIAAAWSRAHGT